MPSRGANFEVPTNVGSRRRGERANRAKKKSTRGRKQDRVRVAGGQDYEVRYEAKKTGKSKKAVKRAAKKAGPSRRNVERELTR